MSHVSQKSVAMGLLISLVLAQLSCATRGEIAPALSTGESAIGVEEPHGAAPPNEVMEALIPTIDLGNGSEPDPAEPRFDVTVDRARARQFFMSLVEGTSYSLALAPGVTGEISLSLRDVTVEEVLDTLQQAYGYGYEKTRTGFLVLPSGLQTSIFRLDYLNLQRSGSSETRVSSGQISDQVSGSSSDITTTNSGSDGSGGGSVSGSRILTSSETDLWNEIVSSVDAIIGKGEGRSVIGSPNAGLLVVKGLPAELAKVASYLRSAEANLSRVVILEAKILEVTLNDGFQSGINWALLQTHNGTSGVIGQSGGGNALDTGFSDSRGANQDTGPPLSDLFAGTMGSAFGGVFSLAIQSDKFSAFIELLETQGEVRTLSNPRISTVNNQKAVIKVGSDEFFVTEVSTTTVTGTATTSSPNVTLTPFFSGIALDVTPQISEADEVILHVHPAVTEVVDQTKTFTVSGEIQELPLALSSIRESDSIIRAQSGQVVVIGGLIQNESRDDTAGVPFFSRIPWLGRLFEHSKLVSRRTELVILLRPIVVANDAWGRELRATSDRLDNIWNDGRASRDHELSLDGWLPPTPPVSN
ncbi:MAG: pilus (MSHA type) biogenesis protein MshL [Deltaproteobacteria bacterium]|nr:pilus (MSHA type) biogenesis protein MshL [Deltaproteobacteria bacterium]